MTRAAIAVAVALVLLVAAGLAIDMHPHFAIESIPGFHALAGLVACALAIAVARLVGRLLGRAEDLDGR